MEGIVFNIQRFSIHDGPGIRTTVFLKGCDLKCMWCHNPESISAQRELQYFPHKCIACGNCAKVCPVNAQRMEDGKHVFIRELCTRCGKCVEVCYAEALVMAGKCMTADEIMTEVMKDAPFYERSQGGVTFSGGEALVQREFVLELLKRSKAGGLHTVIDTAGNVPWATFESVLPYTDLFLYDVKIIDDEKHKQFTGVSNKRIRENLRKLGVMKTAVWIRIPTIPGVNDSREEMSAIADAIAGLSAVTRVELMPYHTIASGKYGSLGLTYPLSHLAAPTQEHIDDLTRIFIDHGLPVGEQN
ncbi:MAG: glycyl-radical enzyme activating protein [Spirochaetota bacterium]